MNSPDCKQSRHDSWKAFFLAFALCASLVPFMMRGARDNTPALLEGAPVAPSSPHGPIVIGSDTAMNNFCAGNDTNGSSWDTAHVIRDHEFTNLTTDSIYIHDTSLYLKIINCTFENHDDDKFISLHNSANIAILNCRFIGTTYSVRAVGISQCNNIIIENCTFDITCLFPSTTLTPTGIYLESTDNTFLKSNNFTMDSENGISVSSTGFVNLTLIQNHFLGCGFGIYDLSLLPSIYGLNDTNTVNGKQISVFENMTGIDDLLLRNAGQLFLINCNNSMLSSLSSKKIQLHDSHWNTIEYNNCSIHLRNSSHNTIANNSILNNNREGVFLRYSNFTTITGNTISNTFRTALRCEFSCENYFAHNTIVNNKREGLFIMNSQRNEVLFNEIKGNEDGIVLSTSNDNNIYYNLISNNSRYGYCYSGTQINKIAFNAFYGPSTSLATSSWYQDWDSTWSHDGISYDNSGNYWEDYTTRYPNATHNGIIWDTPYVVGSIDDQYPLVTPFHLDSNPNAQFDSNATYHAWSDGTYHQDWFGIAGIPVQYNFTGICTNAPFTVTWNFSDGSGLATGETVDHVFSSPGTYNVHMLVNDSDGDDRSRFRDFTILAGSLDPDGDGLTNLQEVLDYKTNPRVRDTDGDGHSDKEEVENGSDPNDSTSIPTFTLDPTPFIVVGVLGGTALLFATLIFLAIKRKKRRKRILEF